MSVSLPQGARGGGRLAVLFGLALTVLLVLPGPCAAQPRIEFAETAFDFGTMYQNEEITHVFTFRNTGDATLVIQEVKTSCGCTAAMPDVREVPPGGEGSISATFRSGTFRDRVTKHIYVQSNDPTQPRVTLTIQGVVKVEIDVSPSSLYLSQIQVGQRVERVVEITAVEVKSFKVTSATSNSPSVQVSKPRPLGNGRTGYALTITVGPLDQPGRVNARVTVCTDLPHTRELTIPVHGKVVGEDGSDRAAKQ